MTYNELKEKHSAEMNAFEGIFYAFNNQQFDEGLALVGVARDEVKAKIASLGNGGYILKSKVDDFTDALERFSSDLKSLLADRDGLLDALTYELANHEYCITGDPTDALDALGITMEDVPSDILLAALKATQYEAA